MLASLWVSQILLWLLLIALSAVCFALIRQLGVLHERIAPVGALSINRQLSAGDVAPAMQLTAMAGQVIDIAQKPTGFSQSGQTQPIKSQLLFFLSPQCPVCKSLLPILRAIADAESAWLELILASDGDDQDTHNRFIEKNKLHNYPYVLSETLGVTYGVSKLPYGVLINEDRTIAALGLVNSREHLESLLEAKALGVGNIQDYLQRANADKSAPVDKALFFPANSGVSDETA